MSTVRSVEWRSTSLTPRNSGFSPTITQQLGEMDTSQSVKAYNASIALSDEVPGSRFTNMRAFCEVLSVTLRIFIFPFQKP